jgi:seryl-tRNA synthetase
MATRAVRWTLPRKVGPTAFTAFLDKLPYVAEAIVGVRGDREGRTWVEVDLADGADEPAVLGKMERAFVKMAKGFFELSTDTVVDHRDRPLPNARPAHAEMIERRWLLPYAPGCVGLQGPALALFHYFESRFLDLAARFEAARMQYPTLIAVDTLNTANYLTSFPHHITLGAHLRGDIDAIEGFQRDVVAPGAALLPAAAEPDHVLSPTVCIHCYKAIAGRQLGAGEMLRATAIGSCFRHERGRLDHKTRLWDFHMREIIFIGPADAVTAARKRSIELVAAWLDELGMAYWIETATDPFFVDNFSAQSFFQLANKTKYELLVKMPDSDRPLAIGSFNVHHDFFAKAFGLTAADGQPVHTGCTAFGVERFVHGFVAQHGLDERAWPEPVRQFVSAYGLACL